MIKPIIRNVPKLVLVSALLLAGAASAQRAQESVKPTTVMPKRFASVLTAMPASTSATFAAECEVVTSWDNIKKKYVTSQNGKVRFRMTGTAPAGAQVTDGNWMIPFAANQTTPGIDVAGNIILVADPSWGSIAASLSVNGTFYLFGGTPVVSFNWPTGMSLWKNHRWASNRCNNVPVGPLTASMSSAILNDIKKASLLTANSGLNPVDISTVNNPIEKE